MALFYFEDKGNIFFRNFVAIILNATASRTKDL